MSGLQLAGIFIVVVIIAGLTGAGIYSIRKGRQSMASAATAALAQRWHRQPNILLGISNICFAILIALVVLTSFETSSAMRIGTLVLIALVFLLSMFLVIRTALSALALVRLLREQQRDKKL